MTSLEAIGAILAKLGWVLILPYLGWSYRRDKVKLSSTLTKKETEDLVDLKMEPIKIKQDTIEKKFDSLMEVIKTDRKSREQNTKMLQEIKTTVAVTQNDIEHVKLDIDELKGKIK